MRTLDDTPGLQLWRKVEDKLAHDIRTGVTAPGSRLPTSNDLGKRFGVNRHTVLKAMAHLQEMGLTRIERGRGIFVVEHPPMEIGPDMIIEQDLFAPFRMQIHTLSSCVDLPATEEVAAGLKIGVGDPAMLAISEGRSKAYPLNYNRLYFPRERLADIHPILHDVLEKGSDFSVEALLERAGVATPRQSHGELQVRNPSLDEARFLQTPRTGPVIELITTYIDRDDRVVLYASWCFSSARVRFQWGL